MSARAVAMAVGVGCQKSSEVVPCPDLAMLGLLPRRPWSGTIPP
jgi:hypothetical protein